jgi:hypothetical protein
MDIDPDISRLDCVTSGARKSHDRVQAELSGVCSISLKWFDGRIVITQAKLTDSGTATPLPVRILGSGRNHPRHEVEVSNMFFGRHVEMAIHQRMEASNRYPFVDLMINLPVMPDR